MTCEICGMNSCTRSFHSLEDQENYDSIADKIKEELANNIKSKINSLPDKGEPDGDYLISQDAALDAVDDCV